MVINILEGNDAGFPLATKNPKQINITELPLTINVTCLERTDALSFGAVITLCVLGSIASSVLIATVIDLIIRVSTSEDAPRTTCLMYSNVLASIHSYLCIPVPLYNEGALKRAVQCFSLSRNAKSLLSTRHPEGSITCISGIRTLSVVWVMYGHLMIYGAPYMENAESFVEQWKSNIFIEMASMYPLSVDTFFTISGLLVTYVTMRKLQNNGLSWNFLQQFYTHRYFRLTPAFLLVFIVQMFLFDYMLNGPLLDNKSSTKQNNCKDSWWMFPLYLNNHQDTKTMCMPWTWSLPVDMQMYFLSPVFLYLFNRFGWNGFLFPLTVTIASSSYRAYVSYTHSLPPKYSLNGAYFNNYYTALSTRCSSFLVGMMAGYCLYRLDPRLHINISKRVVIIGWLLAVLTCLGLLTILYNYSNGNDYHPGLPWMYLAVHSPLWAAVVSWVIFACVWGYGGFINEILSWGGFVPLSKISYSMFLLHPWIIMLYFYTQPKQLYMTLTSFIFILSGSVCLTALLATTFCLLFEIPFSNLASPIRTSPTEKTKKNQ